MENLNPCANIVSENEGFLLNKRCWITKNTVVMNEKNNEGWTAIKKEQRKHQRIQLDVKGSNNSISHCINYTGGCSITHHNHYSSVLETHHFA